MGLVRRNSELYHFGISGQKWGVRRWQYPDGRFTEEGKERYFGKDAEKYGYIKKNKDGTYTANEKGIKKIIADLDSTNNSKNKYRLIKAGEAILEGKLKDLYSTRYIDKKGELHFETSKNFNSRYLDYKDAINNHAEKLSNKYANKLEEMYR